MSLGIPMIPLDMKRQMEYFRERTEPVSLVAVPGVRKIHNARTMPSASIIATSLAAATGAPAMHPDIPEKTVIYADADADTAPYWAVIYQAGNNPARSATVATSQDREALSLYVTEVKRHFKAIGVEYLTKPLLDIPCCEPIGGTGLRGVEYEKLTAKFRQYLDEGLSPSERLLLSHTLGRLPVEDSFLAPDTTTPLEGYVRRLVLHGLALEAPEEIRRLAPPLFRFLHEGTPMKEQAEAWMDKTIAALRALGGDDRSTLTDAYKLLARQTAGSSGETYAPLALALSYKFPLRNVDRPILESIRAMQKEDTFMMATYATEGVLARRPVSFQSGPRATLSYVPDTVVAKMMPKEPEPELEEMTSELDLA